MDIFCLIEVGLNAQLGGSAADVRQGGVGGFLHHVSQVAGELHLAGTGDDAHLHLQDLAPHAGPGQSVDHPHLLGLWDVVGMVPGDAQQLFQVIFCNADRLYTLFHDAHGNLAAQSADLPLQNPDAGLPGIAPDEGPDGAV